MKKMIEYLIKLDYVLGYQRSPKENRMNNAETTCQILMDVKVGNFVLLSIYFIGMILHKLDLLRVKSVFYPIIGVLVLFIFCAHNYIGKRISQSPIKKNIKKMSDQEKRKYMILSYVFSLGTILLWVLAFTWRVILYGDAAMVKIP